MAGRRWCRLVVALVMVWALSGVGDGSKSRPRPKRPDRKKLNPDEDTSIPPENNIDVNQMLGKWYLLSVGSKCSHLMSHGNNAEATTMTLDLTTVQEEQKLSVITTTRHNHQCWEIRQLYDVTQNSGYFIIKAKDPKKNIMVTIVDTDYTSYAILSFEMLSGKRRKTTMKLYTRSLTLHEPTLLKFEDKAATKKIGLEFMFPFPTYSHCDKVDEDHIINCIPTC